MRPNDFKDRETFQRYWNKIRLIHFYIKYIFRRTPTLNTFGILDALAIKGHEHGNKERILENHKIKINDKNTKTSNK